MTINMTEGYPMFEAQGSKDIFTFRFPRFTKEVLYDPTVELMSDSDGSTTDSVTTTTETSPTDTATTQLVSVLVLVICVVLGLVL